MKAGAFLSAAENLPFRPLDEMLGGRGVVVVAPHPDDESLGCSGLIAQALDMNLPVRLVILSDGIGSHPSSPSYPPARLQALRQQETLDAAGILGLQAKDVTFLRLPDRFVPSAGHEAQEAADRIATIADECGAGTAVVTWAHDPHCDHEAAAAIARLSRRRLPSLRLMEYPVWGWSLPSSMEVEGDPRGARIDISSLLDKKGAAIAAHRSQTTNLIDDDPDAFRLEAEMLTRFARPYEIFLQVE